MKYSFKDYLIDTLMFGLSVSITPIIYLSTFIIVNKFNYINSPVFAYSAIFFASFSVTRTRRFTSFPSS